MMRACNVVVVVNKHTIHAFPASAHCARSVRVVVKKGTANAKIVQNVDNDFNWSNDESCAPQIGKQTTECLPISEELNQTSWRRRHQKRGATNRNRGENRRRERDNFVLMTSSRWLENLKLELHGDVQHASNFNSERGKKVGTDLQHAVVKLGRMSTDIAEDCVTTNRWRAARHWNRRDG